ncbi:MAG: DUF2062 domain-containing protein [Paenirhodobacter sp.]
MVFKRRDRRPLPVALREALWPRGGWSRALSYLRLRLNRLPDRPERIARGIFVGILVSFTPLFGAHFLLAAGLAWVLRGNLVAALLATFVGNPLTFPLIALSSIRLGHWLLGSRYAPAQVEGLSATFSGAFGDLGHNLMALFTGDTPHWAGLERFFEGLFLPYLVGGLAVGTVCGLLGYGLALPLISAYQNRRRARLRARLDAARARIAAS